MLKKLISILLTTSLSLGAVNLPAEGHHTKRYNSRGNRIQRAVRERRYNGQVGTASSLRLEGVASWYGHNDGYDGRKTANGERFNKWGTTCAHRTARFGTVFKVTNLANGRSTTCRINDRGPYSGNRLLDLSYGSFSKIAPVNQGLVRVKIEKVN